MSFSLVSLLFIGHSLVGTALAAVEPGSVIQNAPASTRAATGIENPSVGIGLSGVVDWSTQQPFVDVMKTARPWTGHLPGAWGGWTHDDLKSRGYLDDDGWLRAVPDELDAVATLVLTAQPSEAVSTAGRYRLTYRGRGRIEVTGAADVERRAAGEIWFATDPGSEHVIVTIHETDPARSGDYIRDIAIVRADRIRLHETGAVFNPDWLRRIEEFRVLRFMDWMATNGSRLQHWKDRPRPSEYTYTRIGVPIEIMVALANEVAADPWFNVPHMADDDYVERFAAMVRDTLDPALKAHLEYSNEVWNFQFEQARWAEAQGRARWNRESTWVEFYAMRASEIAGIWTAAFGDEADERLLKIIATQTGWLGLEAAILDAPSWVGEDPAANRPPAEQFDAYAVTGYVGGGLVSDAKAPAVRDWLVRSLAAAEAGAAQLSGSAHDAYIEAHKYDLATRLAAIELRDGSMTGNADDTLDRLLNDVLPYHAAVARARGLDLIMYEGGTHVVGHGAQVDDDAITAFLTHFNYTAEMGDIHTDLLAGWRRAGGTLFNAFVDVAAPTKWGSWGGLRHLDDDNPRWRALTDFNAQTPAWWTQRPAGTFAQGVHLDVAHGAVELVGTSKSDMLIGGKDDEIIVSGGGSDRVHGGGGHDVVVLPGTPGDYAFTRVGDRLIASGAGGVATLVGIAELHFSGDATAIMALGEIH
jgi:hypothetical protein